MSKQIVTAKVEPDLIERIDLLCTALGVSRSDGIGRMLEKVVNTDQITNDLKSERKAELDEQEAQRDEARKRWNESKTAR